MTNDIENIKYFRYKALNLMKNRGHLGAALSCAPIFYYLFYFCLNISNQNLKSLENDFFILSNGWTSSSLYPILYKLKYPISKDVIDKYHQNFHPIELFNNLEFNIQILRGSIGHGLSRGVGTAISLKNLNNNYNLNYNNFIYVIVGDGDMMEGITYENMSIAGHLKLNKIIVIYDSNKNTAGGKLNETFSEDIEKRMTALNWNYLKVEDIESSGEDFIKMIKYAKELNIDKNQPTLIEVNTIFAKDTILENNYTAHLLKLGLEFKKNFNEFKNSNKCLEELSINRSREIYNLQSLKFSVFKNSKNLNCQMIFEQNKPNFKNKILISEFYSLLIKNFIKFNKNIYYLETDTEKLMKDKLEKNSNIIKMGVREFASGSISEGFSKLGCQTIINSDYPWSDYLVPAIRHNAKNKSNTIYLLNLGVLNWEGRYFQNSDLDSIFESITGLIVFKPFYIEDHIKALDYALFISKMPVVILLPFGSLIENSYKNEYQITNGAYIAYQNCANEDVEIIVLTNGNLLPLCTEIAKESPKKIRILNILAFKLFDNLNFQEKDRLLLLNNRNKVKTIVINQSSCSQLHKYGDKIKCINDFYEGKESYQKILESHGYDKENLKRFIEEN